MKFLIRRKKRGIGPLGNSPCMVPVLLLLGCLCCVSAAAGSELQPEDCGKCHAFQLKIIAAGGGRHATEITCLDCHPQHPPKGEKTMSACALCHAVQAHYLLDDCLHCHKNPHKPLGSLRDPIKPVRKECLSCHAETGRQMAVATSRHAEFYCNRCHSRHRELPACLDCHAPHLQNQSAADCLRCHPAHQPLRIVPTGYIPASACRVCHEKAARDLAATKTSHGGINCVYCHKGQHPSSPKCRDCHGLPHTRSIHSQYRSCLGCHGDAHRLISNR